MLINYVAYVSRENRISRLEQNNCDVNKGKLYKPKFLTRIVHFRESPIPHNYAVPTARHIALYYFLARDMTDALDTLKKILAHHGEPGK